MRSRRESGQALIVALFVLVLTATAAALVASALELRMRLVRQEARDLKLAALSDAALAEALAHLAESPTFRGEPEHAFSDGILWSEVAALGGQNFAVGVGARVGDRERRVRALVRMTAMGPIVVRWERLE